MQPMMQTGRAWGTLVWLRSPRPVRRRTAEAPTTISLFVRNLGRGIALLPPVSMLMMLLADGGGSPNAFEIVLAGLFISLYALVPAVAGGLVYLPLVTWAARRWPRRGRAIAVATAPLVMLGTLPFGMAGFLGLWWAGLPVLAGLLFYGATIRLPEGSLAEAGR